MEDENKPVSSDWNEAARKSEQSWDKGPGKHRSAPEQSDHDSMERTEEGYGTGKNGADPASDDHGRTPADPPG